MARITVRNELIATNTLYGAIMQTVGWITPTHHSPGTAAMVGSENPPYGPADQRIRAG